MSRTCPASRATARRPKSTMPAAITSAAACWRRAARSSAASTAASATRSWIASSFVAASWRRTSDARRLGLPERRDRQLPPGLCGRRSSARDSPSTSTPITSSSRRPRRGSISAKPMLVELLRRAVPAARHLRAQRHAAPQERLPAAGLAMDHRASRRARSAFARMACSTTSIRWAP